MYYKCDFKRCISCPTNQLSHLDFFLLKPTTNQLFPPQAIYLPTKTYKSAFLDFSKPKENFNRFIKTKQRMCVYVYQRIGQEPVEGRTRSNAIFCTFIVNFMQ